MSDTGDKSEFLIEKAISYVKKKEYEKAVKSLKAALVISPKSYKARKLLISTCFFMGDYEQSLCYLSPIKKSDYTPLILTHKPLPPDKLLKNVYLETYRYTAFDEKVSYFASMSFRLFRNHPLLAVMLHHRAFFMVPKVKVHIKKPCVLLGGTTNYFHWMIRTLPKLKEYFSNPHIKGLRLVVNSDLQPYQIDSLKLMGVSTDRLIKLDPDRVYAVSWMFVLSKVRLKDIFYVRDRLMPNPPENKNLRLFLYRGKSHRRNLANEDEVFERLRPLGFEKVEPGKLPLEEQIRLFGSAAVIVGTHDAGFANLLFAPEGTKVLELTHNRNPMINFKIMSKKLKLDYQFYLGFIDETIDYSSGYDMQMADFIVDVDEVEQIVKSMIHQL